VSLQPVALHYREYGKPKSPPVLMLHGLFGASGNWQGVVKQLQENYRLILPDLRNHGRSPHHPVLDYPSMAADLLALLEQLKLDSATLVGHSMGGKVAMWLALNQPERVQCLVVADIAPVSYASRFDQILQGLRELPLAQLPGREAADHYLAQRIPQPAVRQYLLQNLVKQTDGWQWRFNLPVLDRSIDTLAGFPPSEGLSYAGEVLFLYGEKSDYVQAEHRASIDRLFPHARLRMIHGAGHWLYAEQTEAFSRAVKAFLK
jgi:esterase